MPSFVTHCVFARLVLREAPPAAAQLCKALPAAYAWGSQGPDPFFFSPFAGTGSRLHQGRNSAEVFSAMAAAAEKPAAASFLLGFCTHYALDCVVHPYIEDCTRRLMEMEGLSNAAAHKRCESDLDAAVLRSLNYERPSAVPAYLFLGIHGTEWRASAHLLAVAGKAAGSQVSDRAAQGSMCLMRRFYELLHKNQMETLLRLAEAAAGQPEMLSSMCRPDAPRTVDILNRGRRVWTDWDGAPHTEDVRTLIRERAIPLALRLQACACAARRGGALFPAALFRLDYSGRQLPDSAVPT